MIQYTKTSRVTLGIVGVVLWLLVWQLSTTVGPLVGIKGIPSASDALQESVALAASPELWDSIGTTLLIAVAGLLAATIIGVALGVATARSVVLRRLLEPTLQFVRPLPPVVILPLVLLLLGPTAQLAVFLAAFAAVWPILVHVQVGIRDIEPVALDVAKSLNLSRFTTQRAVVLPSALPSIATGVRIAASASLLLSIGAGLLGGSPGLGQLILIAQQASLTDRAFGLILWSGFLGLALSTVLTALEKLLVKGRPLVEDQ